MSKLEIRTIEDKVRLAVRTPEPSQEFADGLWRQIERQPRRRTSKRTLFGRVFARPAWQAAVLIVLAALAFTLFAIGPQRVLAQVQHWLGYVPGVGFVDLAETLTLGSPVDVTNQGVILRVEQVIAGPESTVVRISSPGLTEADLPWPNQAVQNPDFTAYLLLPDGDRLEMTRWELSVGSGKLEFPALPAGANRVSLLVPRLPLVPAGELPEDWEVPLVLRPVTGDLADDLFPQPYSPQEAVETRNGISLRIENVVQTADETAIQYRVEWADPSWEFRFGLGRWRSPELRDDLGHIYWERPRGSGSSVAVVAVIPGEEAGITQDPAVPSSTGTLVFPALSLSASRAALWVDDLEFQVPVEGSFELDFGQNPQVGDAWPLDLHLEVAGFPVQITKARLAQNQEVQIAGESEPRVFLQFEFEPPQEQNGFSLVGFDLVNPELRVYGRGMKRIANGIEQYTGRLDFMDGAIPSGSVALQIVGASLTAGGPWEVEWDLPGRESGEAAAARLFPQAVTNPEGEMQPTVEEVFLSDRLTAIRFSAEGLPEGAAFVQAVAYDPAAYDPARPSPALVLEDNWGRRYEPGRNLAFLRTDGEEAGPDPNWRFFPPLEPLAQRLSLHVPAMEVFLPGEAGFMIEIPQDLAFHEEEYEVRVIGAGGPERVETRKRLASDPWPVDITIEIADFRLHFTQAQVQHDGQSEPAYRLLLTGEPPEQGKDGFRFHRLRFSEVERPDGEILRFDLELQNLGLVSDPFGIIGQVELGSSEMQAMIFLDVTAENRIDLLSGSYRVELNGLTVWVPGPWKLSWPLTGH